MFLACGHVFFYTPYMFQSRLVPRALLSGLYDPGKPRTLNEILFIKPTLAQFEIEYPRDSQF